MSVNDVMEQAENRARAVEETGVSTGQENITAALTAMAEATLPAPSAAELDAMNTLATALATDELRVAACEYAEANGIYWAALARYPARNKETQEAHRPIAERNSRAWAHCLALLKELGLNELPDRRGFLAELAQERTGVICQPSRSK